MNCLRISSILFLALAALPLAGCSKGGSKSADSKVTEIAFITNNPEEFWNIAEAGCKKAVADLKDKNIEVKVLFQRPTPGTVDKQKEIVDMMLSKKVAAIALSVREPEQQEELINEVAKKVPFIAVDNDAPQSDRLCYIGTNNYEAGKAAGKLVKKALPKGGTVVIFVGNSEPRNAQERRQGVLDELAGVKDAKGPVLGTDVKYTLKGSGAALAPYTDGGLRDKCKENAEFVLDSLPKEENLCLVGLWAYNPPAIYEAVKASKRQGKVKIVGFDEMDETLEGIKDGNIEGTIVQDPYRFGYDSVMLMVKIAKEGKGVVTDKLQHVPHRTITRDSSPSVVEFQAELKKKMGKS